MEVEFQSVLISPSRGHRVEETVPASAHRPPVQVERLREARRRNGP